MTDKIQIHLVFCEDFRMEVGSKPMLLGMLAPVFYTDGGEHDEVLLVTLLAVPAGIDDVELKLSVTIEHPDQDAIVSKYKRLVKRPKTSDAAERWATLLPLRIEIDEWRNGTTVSASLQAADRDAFASVTSQLSDAEDESEPLGSPEDSKESSAATRGRGKRKSS